MTKQAAAWFEHMELFATACETGSARDWAQLVRALMRYSNECKERGVPTDKLPGFTQLMREAVSHVGDGAKTFTVGEDLLRVMHDNVPDESVCCGV